MNLLIYLSIGTLAMMVPIMLQGAWYRVKYGKRIIIALILTLAGTLGTLILYYVENGYFGGTSFFGAVFFVPILFVPVAKFLGIRYGLLMDICAPAECMMLVVMKVQCLISGCCGGRQITFGDTQFVFPSQFMELLNALVICIALMQMSKDDEKRGSIFPWYMVIYGASRFLLNIGREVWVLKEIALPYGNVWSLIAIAIGAAWLFLAKKNRCK